MFYLVMKILDVPPPLYQSTQVKHYSSDVFTRNCNWKNEKVFVIIYSILVIGLFSVIKGNMYVYVRDEEYLIQEMLNKINVFNKFHIFLFEYR